MFIFVIAALGIVVAIVEVEVLYGNDNDQNITTQVLKCFNVVLSVILSEPPPAAPTILNVCDGPIIIGHPPICPMRAPSSNG